MSYETELIDYINRLDRSIRLMRNNPLLLGGVSASGGGAGGPSGGFIGLLPQTRIAYDTTEAADDTTPASGTTLLHNLNHIRYDIDMIEEIIAGAGDLMYEDDAPFDSDTYGRNNGNWVIVSGSGTSEGHIIQDDGVPFIAEPALNFTGDIEVSDDPGVATIVNVSATNHLFIDQLGGTDDTYGILIGSGDGINTEFTVSQGSYVTGTLAIYLNGQLLTQGLVEDWHEDDPATGKFHFSTAPEAGDEITAVYGYLGIGVGSSSTVLTPGIFLMSCHDSADEIAYLLVSEDGKDWSNLHKDPILTPVSGNQRDPAIIKIGNTFWIAHTNSTNTYFTILSSSDLKQWNIICNVDMTNIANLYYVWGPQWFIDEDGSTHIFVCCSTNGLTTNFQIYEVHPTNDTMTTWSSPVLITITGENNIIDPYMVLKDGTYYLWYKEEDTDYIQYASSATLLGTYTNIETGDWAGFGTPRESPCLIQLDSDTWRIYVNEHSGFDSIAVYYSDSTDDWITWSTPIAITSSWIIGAPTVIKLTDVNSLAKITGTFISGNRKRGTRINRSTNQSIPNSTGTPISFTTVERDELDVYDAGDPTKIIVKHSGWYSISGHVKCADTSGGKRVVDIRINGTDYIISSSLEATVGLPGPDVQDAIFYFLDTGDYIELIIWQNQGGAINVTAAQLSVVEI